MQQFIAHLRVSTTGQGQSGLGLDAQREAVARYVGDRGTLVGEFIEVESGRKGGKDRPELDRALAACRKARAALVVGKLDRLARDVRFFLEVIDDSGVDIRFADLPDVRPSTDEGRMILVNMANVAEFEARRISTRTKAALAAARARGTVLGAAGPSNLRPNIEARQCAADLFARKLAPTLASLKQRGLSRRAMVTELNAIGVPAAGGGQWRLSQLQRVLSRIGAATSRRSDDFLAR